MACQSKLSYESDLLLNAVRGALSCNFSSLSLLTLYKNARPSCSMLSGSNSGFEKLQFGSSRLEKTFILVDVWVQYFLLTPFLFVTISGHGIATLLPRFAGYLNHWPTSLVALPLVLC